MQLPSSLCECRSNLDALYQFHCTCFPLQCLLAPESHRLEGVNTITHNDVRLLSPAKASGPIREILLLCNSLQWHREKWSRCYVHGQYTWLGTMSAGMGCFTYSLLRDGKPTKALSGRDVKRLPLRLLQKQANLCINPSHQPDWVHGACNIRTGVRSHCSFLPIREWLLSRQWSNR